MFNLELTEQHRMVEKTARDFALNEVGPRIRDLDRAMNFDAGLLKSMGELGLMGVCIPEAYGGAGMDYISYGLVCEELEYVDTSLRVILAVHIGLNSLSLLTWGTEEQKQKYLTPQAKGEKIACFGLTEPNAGTDVVGLESTAVKDGDTYILNGEKMWISLADVADHFLVIAWTDLEKKKRRDHSGLSAFIVERGFEGVSTASIHGKLGVRAGNTGSISMQDARVPAANLLGREGEGFKIAMFALDQGRFSVASGSTGLIRACRDASVKYALERTSFGKPIGENQLVKQMIAHMCRDYEMSRLLWLKAGWLKNKGERNTRETSLAKWFSCDAAERAAADAVQVYGAYGFSDEYPVERFYRNSKGASIYEGTREIHTVVQADYELGFRVDKPIRCQLPPWPFE